MKAQISNNSHFQGFVPHLKALQNGTINKCPHCLNIIKGEKIRGLDMQNVELHFLLAYNHAVKTIDKGIHSLRVPSVV